MPIGIEESRSGDPLRAAVLVQMSDPGSQREGERDTLLGYICQEDWTLKAGDGGREEPMQTSRIWFEQLDKW